MPDKPPRWARSLPFPNHWLRYVTSKFFVLALAIIIALAVYGF